MKITVTTEQGHKAELSTTTVGAITITKAVAFWRGVRTPAIELMSFSDAARAERYLRRLAAALVDRDALEEVEVSP